jgi:hypothetical protein
MSNLENAIAIAVEAHREQQDRAGAACILHPPPHRMPCSPAILDRSCNGEL